MNKVNLQEIAIQNMAACEITEGVIFAMKQACKHTIELIISNIDECTALDEETDAGCTYVLDNDKLRKLTSKIV